MGAKSAGGVASSLLGEGRDCGGVEGRDVEVGAVGVGVVAIVGRILAREVHECVPKAASAEKAFASSVGAREAKGVSSGSAGGFENCFGAIGGAEGARGLRVGICGEDGGEFGGSGVERVPPVAVGIEDDGAGAKDLLDARGIFSRDADDHVDELGGEERLADERAHGDELSVVFGIFDGNGGGERHGECGGTGYDFGVRRSRTLSLRALPSMDLPSRRERAALITAPICFRESAPASSMACSMAWWSSSSVGAAGR